MTPHKPASRPLTPDLPVTDYLYIWLYNGHDGAQSIGALAEKLKLTPRQVQQAIQDLRMAGKPIASDGRGVWIADNPVDIADTVESMRRRRMHQALTERALRRTLRAMRGGAQLELFDQAA